MDLKGRLLYGGGGTASVFGVIELNATEENGKFRCFCSASRFRESPRKRAQAPTWASHDPYHPQNLHQPRPVQSIQFLCTIEFCCFRESLRKPLPLVCAATLFAQPNALAACACNTCRSALRPRPDRAEVRAHRDSRMPYDALHLSVAIALYRMPFPSICVHRL